MSILQTIDLKKYYGTKPNITRALDGVNFSVNDGEFVAVVGTSGSGKSTLLHMMGGLDTPTSGTVIVRDKELSKMNDEQLTIFRRRNIGFIFQNYNLVPILNVYENIVLPVELDGDTVDQKFLDEIVHLLGLEDKLKNMPNNLSGGQQQREYKMAKADYERLLKVNPASYNGRLGLATLEQKEGKYEEALSVLNNMIATTGETSQLSSSQYAMLYVARAGVEKDLNHMDMALVDLEEAIRLDSSQPEIYLMRGEIYLAQKKKDLAKRDFEKAVSLGVPQADLRDLLQQTRK